MGRARGNAANAVNLVVLEREQHFTALFGARRGTGPSDCRHHTSVGFVPSLVVELDEDGTVCRASMSWDDACQGEIVESHFVLHPESAATAVARRFVETAVAPLLEVLVGDAPIITGRISKIPRPRDGYTTVILQPFMEVELDALRISDASFDWEDTVRVAVRGEQHLFEGSTEYERAVEATTPALRAADKMLATALGRLRSH